MKKLFVLTTLCLLFNGLTHSLSAQSQESRNKIEMVIDYGGKTINISLNSLATSITRYSDPYS